MQPPPDELTEHRYFLQLPVFIIITSKIIIFRKRDFYMELNGKGHFLLTSQRVLKFHQQTVHSLIMILWSYVNQ